MKKKKEAIKKEGKKKETKNEKLFQCSLFINMLFKITNILLFFVI